MPSATKPAGGFWSPTDRACRQRNRNVTCDREDDSPLISRHSSRRQPLDASFLNARLEGATRYDRVAGYFSSSILEIVGEALERIDGKIRVVCNSALSRSDVEVAKAAQAATRRAWCDSRPEFLGDASKPRFKRLYDLLRSGKMDIRVLPDEVFGLIHGKAGVITLVDGRQTSFLGSANESRTEFRLNYELVWEDDSPEAVAWVQEEFDALWSSPFAVRLADFIVEDIERLSRRELIPNLGQWREEPDPASVVVEGPVYRKELGLWEHHMLESVAPGVVRFLPHSFGGASTGASPLPKVRSRCARMACFMVSMNMPDGSRRARSVSVAA